MRKKILISLAIVLFLLAGAGSCLAEKWQEINAGELKKMMDTEDVLVVFPLSRIEYNDLHIKDSVNIPVGRLKEELPADKKKKIVFYCLGRK